MWFVSHTAATRTSISLNYPHVTNGNSNVHVNKDRGDPGSTVMSSGFMQRDNWQPSVLTKEEDKKQAMDEIPQDISCRKQTEAEKSCDGASEC